MRERKRGGGGKGERSHIHINIRGLMIICYDYLFLCLWFDIGQSLYYSVKNTLLTYIYIYHIHITCTHRDLGVGGVGLIN